MLGPPMLASPALRTLLRAPWTLRRLPGLTLWLDAQLSSLRQNSDGTISAAADGDPVGYGQDLSGYGNHPIQATAGFRPLLQLGANGINGLPCLLFDAVDDFLRVTFGAALSQPVTVYVGCSFGSTAAYRYAVSRDAASDFSLYAEITTGYVAIVNGLTVTSTTAASGVQMVSVVANGASSTIRRNGAQIASGDSGTNTLSGVTVGASYVGTSPLGGKMFMLAVYAGAHSVAQQQLVEDYYKARGYWSS